MDWNNIPLRTRVLNDLQAFAKKQGAIFLKIDPDIVLGRGIPNSEGEVTENSGQAVRSELTRQGMGVFVRPNPIPKHSPH